MKFEIGDIVTLNRLTVVMIIEDWNYDSVVGKSIKYDCVWFDKNDVLCRDTFSEKLLIKVD